MWFIDNIVTYCNSASSFFYDIYLKVYGWVSPFWEAAWLFYGLSTLFSNLAWAFYSFSLWANTVASQIANILTWSTIQSYITSWFYYLYDLGAIFYYFATNVTNVITSWWSYTQNTVLTWIADAKSYALAQVNSLRDTILTWINDVKAWTTTQINTAKTAILAVVSDLETWTTTEFNTVRDWVLTLISDVETWATTQINNARTAILDIVSDLSTWTTTQLNNIQAALEAILPWDEILALIISWGAIPAAAVQDLINSTLQSWFPFYNDLVELWDGIKEFIQDPWGWLYDRVEDLFDRFW